MIIRVYGTPAPQGSKRHVGNGVMIESSAKVKPWREAVKYAALTERALVGCETPVIAGAVHLTFTFWLARPKGHYGTGRNAGDVKLSAPFWPTTKPDIDKIVRSTLDALTDAAVFRDDSQVVKLDVLKVYADSQEPGVEILVEAL